MRRATIFCITGLLTATTGLTVSPAAQASVASAAAATPSCHGHKATIVGTDESDVVTGTNHADVIVAGPGQDVIESRGGNDWICGGIGKDRIYPGGGDDHVWSEQGDDVVYASPGNDMLDAGHGSDADVLSFWPAPRGIRLDIAASVATGGDGHDTFTGFDSYGGTDHDDVMLGGRGADRLDGGDGEDTLRGRGGDDYLDGSAANDLLEGGPGKDTLWMQEFDPTQHDIMRGGDGADRVFVYGEQQVVNATVDTGAGDDFLSVDMADVEASMGTGDDLMSIFDGGFGSARVFGDEGDDTLYMRQGSGGETSVVRLGAGDDVLDCFEACGILQDLVGGPGANRIDLRDVTTSVGVVLGHQASVTTEFTLALKDFTVARLGAGDDSVTGSPGADDINAGLGDDTVDGKGGRDRCVNAEHTTSCEVLS